MDDHGLISADSGTTVELCFPESLQAPELGSADLLALRHDLATKIADVRLSKAVKQSAPQRVSATLTRTANGAATYSSSGSARVDFFFKYKGSDPLADAQAALTDQLLHQVYSLRLLPCSGIYLLCFAAAEC